VKVQVEDCGPGLPAGIESRLFEKFTRGEKESAKSGIGLGLAICRAIVEAHEGEIGAVNRFDSNGAVAGATFWCTLPANETPTIEPEAFEDVESREAADDLPPAASGSASGPQTPQSPQTPPASANGA